jgi:hypothetical protein
MKSGRTPKTISVEESVKKLTKPIANTLHNPAGLFWSSSSLKLFSFISAVFHSTLLWL